MSLVTTKEWCKKYIMDKTRLYQNLNAGMLAERYDSFRRNLRKNRPYINRYGGLQRIIGELAGKDVVVIGAGPSLEKSLPVLKKYQHRREVVFLAVDMALRPLLRNGITPKYVISCETIPVGFFHSLDTAGIHLIAFSCMSHSAVRSWSGDMSFFNWMIHESPYDALWKEAGENLGFVATGNIVTTQAVALALGCSLRSLYLAGNDLAFYRQYYTGETVTYMKAVQRVNRFAPMEGQDFSSVWKRKDYELNRDDRRFYTSHQFLAAKMWLEELFYGHGDYIYDGSDPGCSEKSVRHCGAGDFFSRYEKKRGKRR